MKIIIKTLFFTINIMKNAAADPNNQEDVHISELTMEHASSETSSENAANGRERLR